MQRRIVQAVYVLEIFAAAIEKLRAQFAVYFNKRFSAVAKKTGAGDRDILRAGARQKADGVNSRRRKPLAELHRRLVRENAAHATEKRAYFFKRLFPNYETMCFRYPVLKKCKLLLPVFWCVRILSSLTQTDRIKNEASGISAVDETNKNKHEEFLKNVGL